MAAQDRCDGPQAGQNPGVFSCGRAGVRDLWHAKPHTVGSFGTMSRTVPAVRPDRFAAVSGDPGNRSFVGIPTGFTRGSLHSDFFSSAASL